MTKKKTPTKTLPEHSPEIDTTPPRLFSKAWIAERTKYGMQKGRWKIGLAVLGLISSLMGAYDPGFGNQIAYVWLAVYCAWYAFHDTALSRAKLEVDTRLAAEKKLKQKL